MPGDGDRIEARMQRLTIRRYPGRKPQPMDAEALADAANEAARREAGQWFYFVTIMITLAAAAPAHRFQSIFTRSGDST
jgi:hypothetical protein